MLLGILSLLILLLVVRAVATLVRRFWSWLRGGRKVDDSAALIRAEAAQQAALAAAGESLGDIGSLDAPKLTRRAVRAEVAGMKSYLDHMVLGWWQLVMVFLVGSVAGLILEQLWMLATAGLTESRVGLVWGPFSPLYGVGATILTVVCFELRSHRAGTAQVFLASLLIGGMLEQLTGWGMATFLDAQSWSYAALPDAITPWVAWRFLIFWGLLGLLWWRLLMPPLLYTIGMPTTRRQVIFLSLLVVYLVADIGMTGVCFARRAARDAGVPPANAFEQWVDVHYSDAFIAARFQNLTIGENADA